MIAAAVQIEPVFLDRQESLAKAEAWALRAAQEGASLAAFGESWAPGYPLWLSALDGARFEEPELKDLHARSLEQGVDIEAGHLAGLQALAKDRRMMIVVGISERPQDRGGQTLYCTAVAISPDGSIASAHRKLMPTYEERLIWGIGDGQGLRTHEHEGFRVGALNCWENWMPLARAALQAQGETLRVMIWPGSKGLTQDITRFAAKEGRSFVVSSGGFLRAESLPEDLRSRLPQLKGVVYDGGSAIAGPEGEWLCEPLSGEEGIVMAELDPARVRAARQSFDPAGHYSRPDVLSLRLNSERQSSIKIEP
jgi:nitrilase